MSRWTNLAALALFWTCALRADDVDYRPGSGLRWSSASGELNARLGGSLMLDGLAFEDATGARTGDSEVRRARLSGGLEFAERFQIRVSYELAGRDPGWRNLWLGWEHGQRRIRVGQFQQPFGLEELTGSTDLTFANRAPSNVFAPSYRLAGEARIGREAWTLTGAAFRGDLDDPQADDLGFAARWTRLLEPAADHAWHLGLAALYRVPGERGLRFRARPEADLAPVLIDTGRIRDVASFAAGGLELAVRRGRLFVQGEAVAGRLARDGGEPTSWLDGGYIAASWTFAGQSRRYRRGSGSFTAVRGAGRAWGWELAARWSTLDLDDGPLHGGRLTDCTLGVNAVWADWGRLLLDVARADSRRRGDDEVLYLIILQLQLRL